MRYTDRSRYMEFLRCPRARYWGYEYQGVGLSPIHEADALTTGRQVHEGLAQILQGHTYIPTGDALVDGLVLGWQAVRLDAFKAQYEIISVEGEINVPLDSSLTFMSRPDGVLRSKETGELHVLSFKTCAFYNAQTEAQGYHDDQHLSESLAVERAYDERPEAVHMEYLVKGARRQDKETGEWAHDSLFLRAWVHPGILGPEYNPNYTWTDESGSSRRLGKGWTKINPVAELGSMAAWIDWLMQNNPQALFACYAVPVEYPIDWQEVSEWKEQLIAQELRIAKASYELAQAGYPEAHPSLAETFPMNRRACDWPSPCRFQEICYNATIRSNPLQSGLYKLRTPNHPQEIEQCQLANTM